MRAPGAIILPRQDQAGQPLPVALRLGWLGCLLVPVWCVLLSASNLHRDASLAFALLLALALGLLVALALRRRLAMELAGWVSLFYPLAVLGQGAPLQATTVPAWALAPAVLAFLLVQRGRFFPAAPPGPRRAVFRAFRLTAALLVVAELACRLVILYAHPELQVAHEPPTVQRREFVPGRPTLVTLGSSPANFERLRGRPFSVILEERLGDRFNFIYYRRGGLNTDLLLEMADELLAGDRRPDGILLYSGFQDLNQVAALSLLRELDPAGRSATIRGAVRWLVEQSSLVRLVLFELWWSRQRFLAAPDAERAAWVFEKYRANIERLVVLAEARGCRVFAITLSPDRSRLSTETLRYVDRVNELLRGLPARHRGVVVVDFAAEMSRLYPTGRLSSCEPYEPGPGGSPCGDPYHLGPRGHELLAGMLEPLVLAWRSP